MCNTVNGTEWRRLPSEDKTGRFGTPIHGYNSYRKQMEIGHGPFKKISTENRGTVSEPASDGHAASALLGLGSTTISVRQSTGTVINDRCSSDWPSVMLCACMGQLLKSALRAKVIQSIRSDD